MRVSRAASSGLRRGLVGRLVALDPAKDAIGEGEPEGREDDARPGLFRNAVARRSRPKAAVASRK